MKRIFLTDKTYITLFILCVFTESLIIIGNIEFHIEWIFDYSVWINEFICSFLIYVFSLLLFNKIKNQILKEFLSFLIAVIFSNFLYFNFSNINNSLSFWCLAIFALILSILLFILGIVRGYLKSIEHKQKSIFHFKEQVKNTPKETKCLIYNCQKIIKKYPKEIDFILKYQITFINDFIEVDKINRKNNT